MARNRNSWARRIVALSVLALAGLGAYTLYQDNNDLFKSGYSKAKAVKKALKD